MKKILLLLLFFILVGCQQTTQVTVEFHSNGGTPFEPITATANEGFYLPTPLREGYLFLHWYDSSNTIYPIYIIPQNDLILYAKWEAQSFRVFFTDTEDNLIFQTTVNYNQSVTPPTPPVLSGYVFSHWDGQLNNITQETFIVAIYEIATDGLQYTLNDTLDGYMITAYTGTSTEVIIPSHYYSLPVVSIEAGVFEDQTLLTSITLPEGLITIGDYAFKNCSALESILIPESVASIGIEAFYNCLSLTSIVIPTPEIKASAFYLCSNLTSVTLLDTVTTIRMLAFFGCNKLTTLFIPTSVSVIEDGFIDWCRNLHTIYTPSDNVNRLTLLIGDITLIYIHPLLQIQASE